MTAAPFISRKTGQFAYFAHQLGDWRWETKNVLDFGGNIGNMLCDPSSTIDQRRYWCLDVGEESIAEGRERFPSAHWSFYDRYCFFFNPRGVRSLPLPDLGVKFDYILAYSVFTNTGRSDMLEMIPQLEAMLAGGGALAFTYIDAGFRPWDHYPGTNFEWRLNREGGDLSSLQGRRMTRQALDAEWCILVNGEELFVETEEIGHYPPGTQQSHHTFYSTHYMQKLFPHASIQEPVEDEMQHCCVLRKR
ncbi:MAG TPA: class I SAM-dependent methyltransferase [Thermoanaerobaculia bacterium]|nr:class I SAM-dependent methyltransferase [Thermoanaerobaculia bacterium]